MSNLIRQRLREELLKEATKDFGNDVDIIFDAYFADDFNRLAETGKVDSSMFRHDGVYQGTKILESELGQKLHSLSPCHFQINDKRGNFYSPEEKTLGFSVNLDAIGHIRYEGDLNSAFEALTPTVRTRFKSEVNGIVTRGSILHELAHWADDVLNNKHLTKKISPDNPRHIRKNPNLNVNAHYLEIEAQIHSIIQYKKHFGDKWDEISFDQMISLIPPLNHIKGILPPDQLKEWRKRLFNRLHREGLLGAVMR